MSVLAPSAASSAADSLDPDPVDAALERTAQLRKRLVEHVALAKPATDWIDVEAPFTGQVIGRIPHGREIDVEAAVAAARAAQPAWARVPIRQRAAILLRFHDLVLERQAEVLDLIQLENGKARTHAFEEVLDTAMNARYYAHTGAKYLSTKRRHGALPFFTSVWELQHPRGVVGVMSPWNYPLALGINDAIPALMAGNAVVTKPDEQTPYATLWAADLLKEAGLPDGVLHVISGIGAELGDMITSRVDFVMFTGSTAVGRHVAQLAASRLIEYSMELGGKNAMIVLADADLDQTVSRGLRACFSNTGQLCISMERMYVHEDVYDEFVDRFVAATRALTLGTTFDFESDIGSLISAKQLATVAEHVNDAVEMGARVLVGGRARSDIGPYFFEPTLLEGVTPEMTVYRTETFGPLVSVYPFSDEAEAIAAANDSEYGLNFSLWTSNTAHGRQIASKLEAGTVCINEGYASGWGSTDAPMGGFKNSGTGRRHGEHGITKYCESQAISVQRVVPLSAPPGIPGDKYAAVMTTALSVLKRLPGMRW
ncbi:MAG: succinic semialdehyde dehydrogenase [Candidatus Nanopelagicales bacterium]